MQENTWKKEEKKIRGENKKKLLPTFLNRKFTAFLTRKVYYILRPMLTVYVLYRKGLILLC